MNIIKSFIYKIKKMEFFETLKHSIIYFFGNVVDKALGIISIPILTRILSVSDYGIINVFTGWIGILVFVIPLNTNLAIGRYFFEEKEDFKEFFGTTVLLNVILSSSFFILFFIFRAFFSKLFQLPVNTILFVVPIVLFFVGYTWFEQIHIREKKSKIIIVVNIITSYSIFIISIIIILLLSKNKYLGQIISRCFITFIFFIYYFIILKKYMKLNIKSDHVKYIFSYSIPLLPHAISGVILIHFDRILINKLIGTTEAGLYSLAYNIGMLLIFVIQSLYKAWTTDYYLNMNKKNYNKINSDIKKMFNIVLFAAFFIILFGKDMGLILASKKYSEVVSLIPIINIAYIFYAVFIYYSFNISYSKKNIYSSIALTIAGVINIILNIILLPRFGYFICSYTSVFCYFLMALLIWFFNKYFVDVYCTPLKIFIIPLLLLILFTSVYYYVEYLKLNFFINLFLKLILFSGFSLFIFKDFILKIIKNV